MQLLAKLLLILILAIAVFLRFYKISEIPHGLYIDEVAIGYNAHTILHTGKDEYGTPLPLFFKSFGDYKLPVYIYLTSLSMVVFGKTEFAVRFPSALFGSLTVLLIYFFIKSIFSFNQKLFSKKMIEPLSLVGALLLAITPWHLQFSRAGFEANVALFFFLFGLYMFIKFSQQKVMPFLLLGSFALVLSMYTYHSYKLLAPITFIFAYGFLLQNSKEKTRKKITSVALFSLLLTTPMLLFSWTANGISRFNAASAFSEYPYVSFVQQFFFYPIIFLKNYFSYFDFTFLFVSGDGIGRHTIGGIGALFRWELPALLLGSYYLIKNFRNHASKLLLFLLIIAPSAAALARPSPHLLRSSLLVIPITILVAIGIMKIWEYKSKWKYAIIIIILLSASFEFLQYLHLYYTRYPLITALDWGAEYKQLILEASKEQKQYPLIVINSNVGNISEYIKFYNDKLPYILVTNTWQKPEEWKNKKILYITSPNTKQKSNFKKHIEDIRFPNQTHDIFAQFWEI